MFPIWFFGCKFKCGRAREAVGLPLQPPKENEGTGRGGDRRLVWRASAGRWATGVLAQPAGVGLEPPTPSFLIVRCSRMGRRGNREGSVGRGGNRQKATAGDISVAGRAHTTHRRPPKVVGGFLDAAAAAQIKKKEEIRWR
uniref:Uncharacterized protein n=1 Tax=Nymphaea colorata TaxID=210225 RepID=A0A5K1DCS2_9MAGN